MGNPWVKYGGLAVVMGAAAYFVGPLILPTNVPADFPKQELHEE